MCSDIERHRVFVYARAISVLLAQLTGLFIEKNWSIVAAAVVTMVLFMVVIPSEMPQFLSLVITEDGRHAVGQRIFGVPSAQ